MIHCGRLGYHCSSYSTFRRQKLHQLSHCSITKSNGVYANNQTARSGQHPNIEHLRTSSSGQRWLTSRTRPRQNTDNPVLGQIKDWRQTPSLSLSPTISSYSTTTAVMIECAYILAYIVLFFFTMVDALQRAFNGASVLVSSAWNIVFGARSSLSPVNEYPRFRPRSQERRGPLGRFQGLIGHITSLFGITSIVSLNRPSSLVSCLAWISRPNLHCLWFRAIAITNFAANGINKAKEWNPFNYFALLRQLEAAKREARLLEEGLYQSTVEIKNLKAMYKVKERENRDLVRRVADVEEDLAIVVENLEARLEEKGKTLEEEMVILRKEKDVEIEMLKMEKEAEIVELKEQSRVVEKKNAEQIAALKEENEVLREEKTAVETENEILKEENTKIQKKVEEVYVDVKVAQDKARVASAQLFGMEIARKEEGKKRIEAESMVVTLREELEIAKRDMEEEKKGRETERVAMELERATYEENTRKSQVEHRQEIDAFVGQLRGAWNRALDLDSQLDVANHHKNAFQAQLKDAQDSLVTMTGEKEILALENQNLQEEVARLREEVARAAEKKEVEGKEQTKETKAVADFGIDLEKLKRDFEARDRVNRNVHVGDETTVAEECSVMDGEDTVLDITVNRFNTPGRKKQPAIGNKITTPSETLLVATKDDLVISVDVPVVRLPTAGKTRILPPIQGSSVDTHVHPVETNSIIPFSFDPAPIQVRLPTFPKPPMGKNAQGGSRSSWPAKSKEAAPFHHKKPKSRRGRDQWDTRNSSSNETFRPPLRPITNQSSHKNTDRGGGCKGILGRGSSSGRG